MFVIVLLAFVPGKAEEPKRAESKDEARIHFATAVAAINAGDFSTARRELTNAAAAAPDNAVIWYNLAIVEEKLGAVDAALEHVTKARAIGLSAATGFAAETLAGRLLYERKTADERFRNLSFLNGTFDCEPDGGVFHYDSENHVPERYTVEASTSATLSVIKFVFYKQGGVRWPWYEISVSSTDGFKSSVACCWLGELRASSLNIDDPNVLFWASDSLDAAQQAKVGGASRVGFSIRRVAGKYVFSYEDEIGHSLSGPIWKRTGLLSCAVPKTEVNP